MATSIFKEFTLGGTLGVTLLGACVSSMLYGVTCLQTFTYYRSKKAKNDSFWLHIMVAVLLVLDTTHQAVVIHIVYNFLVLDFANPRSVVNMVWSIPTEVVLNSVLALILNGFLTLRLWRLSRLYSLTALGATMAIANLGTTCSYGIRVYQYSDIFDAEISLRTHGIGGLSISVATEVTLSFSLAYLLHTHRTVYRRSNDMITKLITLTVTTGMLTTLTMFMLRIPSSYCLHPVIYHRLTNLVDLIAYVTVHNNLYILFFNFLLGKLYANAILTSLNSRQYVLGLVDNVEAPAILTTPTNVGRRGGTSRMLESPARHYETRIDMNHFVTSTNSEVDASATKFESV